MKRTLAGTILSALVALGFAGVASAADLKPEQRALFEIYKELVEINTADSVGSTTVAANAVAKRLRDAGFPESDIFQGGPKPDKGNIVVRYHGCPNRDQSARKSSHPHHNPRE